MVDTLNKTCFCKTLSDEKFNFLPRDEFNWETFYGTTEKPSVFYDEKYIDFRFECISGNGLDCKDFSFGIELNGELIAIVPLFFNENNEGGSLNFFEGTILPPLLVSSISDKLKKEVCNLIIQKISGFSKEYRLYPPLFFDQMGPSVGLDIWHKILLDNQYQPHLTRELFTSLDLSYSEIKSHYRKSYKSLISKGNKLFTPFKMTHPDKSVWNAFKELHFKAAGRKTRSELSWEMLYDCIKSEKADFYFSKSKSDEMVGGSLILKNKYEAFYAVAAYDRELFHLPIGHQLQDFIIKDLLNSSLSWYRVGRYYLPYDFDNPTEKEVQIAQFKSGFSTHLISTYRFFKAD